MDELMTLLDQALRADKAYKSSVSQQLVDEDEKLEALFSVLSEIKDTLNRYYK